MTAAETMGVALIELTDHEQRPPCGDRSGAWTSEDKRERAWAARRCQPCPLLKACHDLAAELKPSFGVWSGVDWTRRITRERGPDER